MTKPPLVPCLECGLLFLDAIVPHPATGQFQQLGLCVRCLQAYTTSLLGEVGNDADSLYSDCDGVEWCCDG